MESEAFDRLVRVIEGEASRRGVVRAGIGALLGAAGAAAGLGPAGEAAARTRQRGKGRKKARAQKKKKKQALVPGPPGPQGPAGPPGPPAAPRTCTAPQPVTCGTGCCPAHLPLGCESDVNPEGKSCNPSGNGWHCCGLAHGGDACGGNFPQCCPVTKQAPFGNCAGATDKCCPTTHGGFDCPADLECCPSPASGPDVQRCCADVDKCCVTNFDCVQPETCENGCCIGP